MVISLDYALTDSQRCDVVQLCVYMYYVIVLSVLVDIVGLEYM